MSGQEQKPEENRPGVLTRAKAVPRTPPASQPPQKAVAAPQAQPPPQKPVEFKRTKRIRINGPNGMLMEIEAPSVDFRQPEIWMPVYLANGDEIQIRLVVTEVYDTKQMIEGDPLYHVKWTHTIRTIPGGRQESRGIPVSLGENITTDESQGPRDE